MKKQYAKPKVSVVVPVYGVEKYLRQCVDSILAQTLRDIEVILVDDGSPDKCPEIIDEYAARDTRVVALHQPNGGYGRAVNRGIEAARGDFIGIIESDDWIEPDMYEKLYAKATADNSDVVKCSFYKYDSLAGNKRKINRKWKIGYVNLFDAPDRGFALRDFPQIVMFHASVWAGMYRGDFIRKNNIRMIETNRTMYQDFPFMCEVMSRAESISVVKDYLVHYRMEEGQNSSTKSKGQKSANVIQMASRCIDGIEILKNNGVLDIVKEEIYFHAWTANMGFFREIAWQFKGQYFDELYRLFMPLQEDHGFKFRHFKRDQALFVNLVMNNDFINAEKHSRWNFSFKNIRKFLISFHNPYFLSGNKGKWHLTLLGVQFGHQFYNRPALFRVGK
jgi:glycosyltransferase involved in cell wall biosynthesis